MGKRGPTCSVCLHNARAQIEIGLTNGIGARVLASRFGFKRHDAILRHARNHLSPAQRAAILSATKPTAIDLDELRKSESEGLLSNLAAQRARLQTKAEIAMEIGDFKASIAAENSITCNLTLVAKLLGQLTQTIDVRHTSLLVSPDYLRLREALIVALKPFPDAAKAVSAALYRIESDAAKDITSAAKQPALIEHSKPAN